MKKITMLLFGAVFVALIISSVESTYADHSEVERSTITSFIPYLDEKYSIFSSMDEANIAVSVADSKYQIHLQTVMRNGDGHLINVNESTSTAFIPHKITDNIFDTILGEKEIVTVDGIKYEKAQITFTPTLQQRYISIYPIYSEVGKFQVEFSNEVVTDMQETNKEHSNWKLHYCADFGKEHGIQCVAIFFCLVPSVTLEPSDTVTQQWTILRVMN